MKTQNPFAFKVLDKLPLPIENLDGASLQYKLVYNEDEDSFHWEVIGE